MLRHREALMFLLLLLKTLDKLLYHVLCNICMDPTGAIEIGAVYLGHHS